MFSIVPLFFFIIAGIMMLSMFILFKKKSFAWVYEKSLANYKRLRKQLVDKLNYLESLEK